MWQRGRSLDSEMSADQIKHILDQLDDIGVSDVSITGGEPLLRDDCLEILEYAAGKQGFYLTLNTNGLLITERLISFLEEHCPKVNVAVSLDGYNAETYSILRRSFFDPGKILLDEFEQVKRNLQMLANSRLEVGVNYTITHATIGNVWDTYDFVKGLGIHRFLGIKFFPYGYGREYREELELNYQEWKAFYLKLLS